LIRYRVVLVSPRNPLNIGAAARAMANFGLDDLAAVSPFAAGWREARSAVGAERLLREARSVSMSDALSDCHLVLGTTAARRREIRKPLIELPGARDFIDERLPSGGRVALLFGSEKRGLANRDLERCHALLRVPTDAKTPSMNLSHAVAVVCYELGRNRPPTFPLPHKGGGERLDEPPTVEQLDDLVQKGLGALERVGYMKDLPKAVQSEKLRRKFLRWRMTRSDSAFLQAFFKRVK
jgi:TrmH family RNA methyltransferase